jgi:hypothetical protein
MGTQPIYVPMLKGKEGEFSALEVLAPDIRPSVMPLIEIPGIPYDYANERPVRTLAEHVDGISERLGRCWPNLPLYLHLPWFGEQERMGDGRVALESVLADCSNRGVKAVPVVWRQSSSDSLTAAGRYSETTGFGPCIRLRVEDFEEDTDLDAEINRLIKGLGGIDANSIDLILYLEDLGTEANRALLVTRSVFSMIPQKDQWKRVILAAASFPEDLSDVGAATTTTISRREWELWKALQRRPNILPRRDLIFGDYAIAHPVPKELDPRIMQMSASIRYTTPDEWLIVKGRNVRQYGFDQYFELCKTLIGRPEYCGRDYSWGDRYIDDCANGMKGPGNATTWRKVGTNHHLTLVTRELAKLLPGA